MILNGLNPQQAQAVRHTEGPLLIFAGAGSGKTRVIVHRVAYLLQQGVSTHEILCLTFTNKAANEMKTRLKAMLGIDKIDVWAGTFHAFGAWFLRREAHRIGFPGNFIIYDEADQKSLISKCLKEINRKPERGEVATVSWLINYSRDTLQDIEDIPCSLNFDPARVIRLYEQRKKEYGVFDFADLLYVPCRMLSTMPEIRDKYRERFQHILVDEYQDTNMAQYSMIMNLVGTDENICVVGDDDQSIYGWRGADVGNILRFKDDFPKAAIITLEENYRSTEDILNAATSLIVNNQYRAPKQLRAARGKGQEIGIVEFSDAVSEASHVAFSVKKLLDSGVGPADIGVFYRVNALSRLVEESFVKRAIPYAVYGGMRFYERKEIKDILAYLRVMANPYDEEAISRVINTPSRGIGAKSYDNLRTFAKTKGLPTIHVLRDALEDKVVKGKAAKGVEAFLALIEGVKVHEGSVDIADLIEMIAEASGLLDAIKGEPDGQDRIANIEELMASARSKTDLTGYLEEKSLMSATDIAFGESVSVMTLHMSKGLEFDYVYILGLEEGLLPHSRSMNSRAELEEERRLLYVGMTRARRQVMLSWSRVRALYGRESYQIPSGFLNEIEV